MKNRILFVLLGVLLCLPLSSTSWAAPTPVPIDSTEITSPTGVAADSTNELYWTTNGTKPVVYGINETGKLERTVSFNADITGVEAVSFHKDRLYLADTGGADSPSNEITVYRPKSLSEQRTTAESWVLTYPSGESHRSQTFMISAKGNIYVVTSEADAGIYLGPNVSNLSQGRNYRMKRVADAPAWVSDGTFIENGSQMLLRTYTSMYVVDAYSFEIIASDFIKDRPTGKALTQSLDQRNIVVLDALAGQTSLQTLAIPTQLVDVGVAPSIPPQTTPPATADPTPTPSVTTDSQTTQVEEVSEIVRNHDRPSNKTLLIGLAIAVIVATGAAIVVGFFPEKKKSRKQSTLDSAASDNDGLETAQEISQHDDSQLDDIAASHEENMKWLYPDNK